jgi:pimeloyl-ACP methyl ester carboxylesterase
MASDDSANPRRPTIVTVPCFSGAPWELEKLKPLSRLPLKTMRLPEGQDDVEQYADFVAQQVAQLSCYVLMGDSFGAVVSLAFATRRPPGLRALILSGGFAANPVRNPLLKARIKAARFLPGSLYRMITLRMHAASLSSPYDAEGQVPWSDAKSRELFRENTPYRSYVARAKGALRVDYLDRLDRIDVPTLIIRLSMTP